MKSAIVLVVLIGALALGDAFINNSKQTLSRKRPILSGGIGASLGNLDAGLGISIGSGRSTTARPVSTTAAAAEAEPISPSNPDEQNGGAINEGSKTVVEEPEGQESGDQTNSGNNNNRPGLGLVVDLGPLGGVSVDIGKPGLVINGTLGSMGTNVGIGKERA